MADWLPDKEYFHALYGMDPNSDILYQNFSWKNVFKAVKKVALAPITVTTQVTKFSIDKTAQAAKAAGLKKVSNVIKDSEVIALLPGQKLAQALNWTLDKTAQATVAATNPVIQATKYAAKKTVQATKYITKEGIKFTEWQFKLLNSITLAPAFLLLLRINFFGLATKLYQVKHSANPADVKRYNDARDIFAHWTGGNRNHFDDNVENGHNSPPFKNWKVGFDGKDEQYFSFLPAVPAAIAAASPIVVAVINKVGKPSGINDADLAELLKEGKLTPAQEAEYEKELAGITDDSGFPLWGYFAIGGGILLLGGLAYWYFFMRDNK